jgi:hypothetical protein
MTRIFLNATIRLVNVVVGEKNMPIRIIFGQMEDVRKEFDAVIIIIATIILLLLLVLLLLLLLLFSLLLFTLFLL